MINCSHFAEKILSFYEETRENRTTSSKVYHDNIFFSMIVIKKLRDFSYRNNFFSLTDKNANVHYTKVTNTPTSKN